MSPLSDTNVRVKLIIIGDAGVGKSSLVRKYVHDDFQGGARRTSVMMTELRTISRGAKTVEVEIWDTAGQERYDSLTGNYYRRADGCFIVYDVCKLQTFEAVHKWNRKRMEYRGSGQLVPAILVASKCDLRSTPNSGISTELGKKLSRELDIPYYEVTCTNTASVNALFDKIVDMVLDGKQSLILADHEHEEADSIGGLHSIESQKSTPKKFTCC